MTILMTPATPDADWVWPMLDFTEPSHSGRSSFRSWPYVDSSERTSMESPSGVPVPCPSTASTSVGCSPAVARARRMRRSCEGPLGDVRPLDAPWWLMALPRTTARTSWLLRRASESRSTTRTPTPSAQPMPSASAEKDLHRPSEASSLRPPEFTKALGVTIVVTPPARASEQSPWRSAWIAQCSATRDEEQAVSTVTAGPSKPRA